MMIWKNLYYLIHINMMILKNLYYLIHTNTRQEKLH